MILTEDELKKYKQLVAKLKPIRVNHSFHLTEYVYDVNGLTVQVLTSKGLEDGDISVFTAEEWIEEIKPWDVKFAELKAAGHTIKTKKKTGVQLINEERERHFSLGYDANHDAFEANGELAVAAAAYALDTTYAGPMVVDAMDSKGLAKQLWPWDSMPDKRGNIDRVRELTIAGALIAAEIDRIQNEGRTDNTEDSKVSES